MTFLFPGQGSQYFQMGRDLFERNQTFRLWMLRADEWIKRAGGPAVLDTVYSPARTRTEPFDSLPLTHPAIFMFEYALAQAVIAEGIYPDAVAGASLGEVAAAAIAGALSFESALEWVVTQGGIIESACPPGGMVVVLQKPDLFYQSAALYQNSEFAGSSAPSHFVVSALREKIPLVEAHLRSISATFLTLPVRRPFHSSWLDPARSRLAGPMSCLPLNPLKCLFYSASSGGGLRALENGHFWDLLRRPILFRSVVGALEAEGAHTYVDCGPGGALASILKYNLASTSRSKCVPIDSPFGAMRNWEKLIVTFRASG